MLLAGIDLAWKADNNTTAISFGELHGNSIRLTKIYPEVKGIEELKSIIFSEEKLRGVAIDAPLAIKNISGQRNCEKLLNKDYAAYWASCHTSNLTRYPEPSSARLSRYLEQQRFQHLQDPAKGRFQIECYPHPAIIEIFGLTKRLLYKKGNKYIKQEGQIQLSRLLMSLRKSTVVSMIINSQSPDFFNPEYIYSLVGNSLKVNEDVLDSTVCLYICALFVKSSVFKVFGQIDEGYIYVPTQKCNI